ncbi:NERD domain-containing protein [Candidatus Micrarchaeota archaeon]|nr:NERD domain-containing protein [Candidatus Micrarchaeota archaeon]
MGSWKYIKGAHYERELLKEIQARGFFVTRAAGSGIDGLSPDLIVLSTTKKFALECKAWKGSIRIEKDKLEAYKQWEQRTGLPVYIAWKRSHKEWRFFPLSSLKETPKAFMISKEDAGLGMVLDEVVGREKNI